MNFHKKKFCSFYLLMESFELIKFAKVFEIHTNSNLNIFSVSKLHIQHVLAHAKLIGGHLLTEVFLNVQINMICVENRAYDIILVTTIHCVVMNKCACLKRTRYYSRVLSLSTE